MQVSLVPQLFWEDSGTTLAKQWGGGGGGGAGYQKPTIYSTTQLP